MKYIVKIQVIIADDHEIIRDSAIQSLESKFENIIVGEATDGKEVKKIVTEKI